MNGTLFTVSRRRDGREQHHEQHRGYPGKVYCFHIVFNIHYPVYGVKVEGRRLKFCKQFVVRQDGDAGVLLEVGEVFVTTNNIVHWNTLCHR